MVMGQGEIVKTATRASYFVDMQPLTAKERDLASQELEQPEKLEIISLLLLGFLLVILLVILALFLLVFLGLFTT